MGKWAEIRTDYMDDDGTVCVDAWMTADDNEEGTVIARIDSKGNVHYLDEDARTDAYAQEEIRRVLSDMGGNHEGD